MKLIVNECWTSVEGRVSDQDVEALNELLSVTDPGAWYDWRYKRKLWDGKIRLLYADNGQVGFPTGLLDRATEFLTARGLRYRIEEHRDWESLHTREPLFDFPGYTPHPDQIEALTTILTERRGTLNLATNFGKTDLAAALFKYLNRPALFLLDRKGLAKQTWDRFRSYGLDVGMIADSKWAPGHFTVATIQSLNAHLDRARPWLNGIEVCVVDEAQRVTPNYYPVLSSMPRASVRIGLGATITETSKPRALIEAYLGPLLMTVDEAALIADGRSARPVTTFRVNDEPFNDDDEDPESLKWPAIREHGIVYSERRNTMVQQDAADFAAAGKQTLVLVQRLPHGEILRDYLDARGVDCRWVCGQDEEALIERTIEQFSERRFPILIGSGIFDIGRSVPAIEGYINAAGGLDDGLTTQRRGRALRRKAGENVVWVRDYMDTGHRILLRHSEARWKLYERKGGAPRYARTAV